MNSSESMSKDMRFQFGSVIEAIETQLLRQLEEFPLPADEVTMREMFAMDYLLGNIRRKRVEEIYSTPPTGRTQELLRRKIAEQAQEKRRSLTLDGFLEREAVNRAINQNGIPLPKDCRITSLLYDAKRIVRGILGSHPNMKRIFNGTSYGNGASATLRRAEADRTLKWVAKPSSTRETFELMRNYMSCSPLWVNVLMDGDPVLYIDTKGYSVIPDTVVTFRNSSVLDMVPKTVSVDRIILKEPELNGFLQKGIGKEIRRLLKRKTGISLNQSGVKNSKLAQYGSETGLLATIDAERASDSLTIALYKFLLPVKWFELLMAARTPFVEYDIEGVRQTLELSMMSGMGNGFTFEAESIIFYALGAAASAESNMEDALSYVSIHGDDLIVPADVAHDVMALYERCGIVVNKEKSFVKGPFRESCGGHFYNGESVKPFYVKKETGAVQGDWFWLYNSLLLWVNERNLGLVCTDEYSRILMRISSIACSFETETKGIRSQPLHWRIPVDRSRRSGLYSNAPKLQARKTSWKFQYLKTVATKACTNMYGAYMQSLACPMRVTAYDLILGVKSSEADPWEVDTDTVEAACFGRTTVWNGFNENGLRTPLWFYTFLKSSD